METLLFWLYIANATLLITHEIDSAYWKEWLQFNEAFGMFSTDEKKEIRNFVLIHIPMVLVILLGVKGIIELTAFGLGVSVFLSFAGIFAFFFHGSFILKKRKEFNTPVSKAILISSFVVSIAQAVVTSRFIFTS